jgi:integrase
MNNLSAPKPLDIIHLIESSHLADSTKTKYIRAVQSFLATGHSLTDPAAIRTHAATLSHSRRAHLKAALKLWSDQLALEFKGRATPDNIATIQAALLRLEALQDVIHIDTPQGRKLGLWLSQREVRRLLATCDPTTLHGRRDKIVLGLLTGAGLRREELVALTFENMALRPLHSRFRTVLSIAGKGKRKRTIPISDRLATALDDWGRTIGATGPIARAIDPRGDIRAGISSVAIFNIVTKAGAAIDKPDLAPHDLRRTYAQLGYEAGIPITQISKLLGHASIETTQRYLNLTLNLEETIGDFIPFD